jgi:hypothetical protein
MNMSADAEVDYRTPPADLNRELALVARQLAEHCLAIDLAVARDDFDVVCTSVECAKVLHQHITVRYRQLLARRTTPTRICECSSL